MVPQTIVSSQFKPKIAIFNPSETKYLVFVIKKGILNLFLNIEKDNQQKHLEKSFFMVKQTNMGAIDWYSQISM